MSAMDILVDWIEILTAGDDRTKSPSPTFIANLIIRNIRNEAGAPAALTSDDMWFGDPKNMPPEDQEFFDPFAPKDADVVLNNYICKKQDWDHDVIDVFLVTDGVEYQLKGFDDVDWEEADAFVEQIAKNLNIDNMGDMTDT
jgi:hypothetical protein